MKHAWTRWEKQCFYLKPSIEDALLIQLAQNRIGYLDALHTIMDLLRLSPILTSAVKIQMTFFLTVIASTAASKFR